MNKDCFDLISLSIDDIRRLAATRHRDFVKWEDTDPIKCYLRCMKYAYFSRGASAVDRKNLIYPINFLTYLTDENISTGRYKNVNPYIQWTKQSSCNFRDVRMLDFILKFHGITKNNPIMDSLIRDIISVDNGELLHYLIKNDYMEPRICDLKAAIQSRAYDSIVYLNMVITKQLSESYTLTISSYDVSTVEEIIKIIEQNGKSGSYIQMTIT